MFQLVPISNSRVIVGIDWSDPDLDFSAVRLHLMKRSKRFHVLWWKIRRVHAEGVCDGVQHCLLW